jgi:glycosyltransferase involved in cell wall biosynthesis
VHGYGSHAQVTAGFAGALRASGLMAGLVAFDQDLPPDSPQPGGAMAPKAVFTGPLGFLPAMRRGARHAERYAMLAPNSSFVPGNLLLALEGICTEILVPSKWARSVVEEQTSMPVRVVPHGVAPDFAPLPAIREATVAAYRRGDFNVLHLSSSVYERKGTRELLEAWAMLCANGELPDSARLRLVLEMDALARTAAWMAESSLKLHNVALTARLDARPASLSETYAAHHVVCQPSRGEGFGFCPVESLACGVPIVATTCTGHSEWFWPRLIGAVPVEHGPDAPIDDGPGALAPSVSPDAIAAALRQAYTDWERLNAGAAAASTSIRVNWAWQRQLAPFVEVLRQPVEPEPAASSFVRNAE